jgi:DNA (cytosine-5)-methyltransferase 1
MMQEKERILDLCCGAGAGAVGFESHFSVQEAVDISRDAASSYAANHARTSVHCRDVLDYWGSRHDFEGIHGVLATPPCQGFSKLNKHARDGRSDSRNALTGKIAELVAGIRPEFVILENVPQITQEVRKIAEGAFRSREYNVMTLHMNAAEYGSAQRRTRWIMMATRKGRKIGPLVPKPARTVREAFAGLPENFKPRRNTSPKTREKVKAVAATGMWTRSRNSTAFADTCRLAWDQPAPAVTNIAKTYLIHPDEDRVLEEEEALLLFGVPATYKIVGNVRSRGQQIANMMTVEMASAIGSAIAAGGEA